MKQLTLIMALVFALLFGCGGGDLTRKDKVSIALEVLRDTSFALDLYNAQMIDTDPPKPTQLKPGYPGRSWTWDSAQIYAKLHTPRSLNHRTPVYVEFKLGKLISTLDSAKKVWLESFSEPSGFSSMSLSPNDTIDLRCRAYFIQDHIHKDFRSIVFVPCFGEVGDTVFSESKYLPVFNVGSACPPDCGTGRPQTQAQGDTTGAYFARKAFLASQIPCLQYGATPQDCK